jgi:hypothetical protein
MREAQMPWELGFAYRKAAIGSVRWSFECRLVAGWPMAGGLPVQMTAADDGRLDDYGCQ